MMRLLANIMTCKCGNPISLVIINLRPISGPFEPIAEWSRCCTCNRTHELKMLPNRNKITESQLTACMRQLPKADYFTLDELKSGKVHGVNAIPPKEYNPNAYLGERETQEIF